MDLRELDVEGVSTQRHPWEVARADFFERRLRRHAPRVSSWLDAGAGDAWLANRLRAHLYPRARLECWDAFYTDEFIAQQAWADGQTVVATREPSEGPFDLITAFDMLEHVEDDRAMLARFSSLLAPEGTLAMSVPAWPFLAGHHDRQLLHHRRYWPRRTQRLLLESGFRIVADGGLFHSPLPVRVMERLLEAIRRPQDVNGAPPPLRWTAPPLVTSIVRAALRIDTELSDRLSPLELLVPGLSYWAFCVHADGPQASGVKSNGSPG